MHPGANRSFHGRDVEYVKVLCREPLFSNTSWYTNDRIVNSSQNGDWVYGVEDDAVYANYCAATAVAANEDGGDDKKIAPFIG